MANFIENVKKHQTQKNPKTAAMRGAKMRWSWRRAKSTVPIRNLKFLFKTFFPKTFPNTKITTLPSIRGAKMRRSQRRAKSTVPIASLQISLKTFFRETREKQKNPKATEIKAAKMRRSQRGGNPRLHIRFLKI